LILTDREIVIALGHGLIIIDPRPKENYFASTSVDLTLDPILTKFKTATDGLEIVIYPSHVDFSTETTLAELTEALIFLMTVF
jgi:dCTP deaminase